MPTFDRFWPNPITVRLQNGSDRLFRSLHDTLDFLEHEWPTAHGPYHDAAVICCRGALMQHGSTANSIDLFLEACLEAGLAVPRHSRVSPPG
jgi:hypothetical protein